jgi:hypothetical protein
LTLFTVDGYSLAVFVSLFYFFKELNLENQYLNETIK